MIRNNNQTQAQNDLYKREPNNKTNKKVIKAVRKKVKELGIRPTKAMKIMHRAEKAMTHRYIAQLINPFNENTTAKIPGSGIHGQTFTHVKTYYTSFKPNAAGNAFLSYIPLSIGIDTGAQTPLLIDNTATYSPTTGQASGTPVVPVTGAISQLGWKSGDVRTNSLVSAGMRIYFENLGTTLQPQGRVYCMRESDASGYNSTPEYLPQTEHTISYIIAAKEHHDFKNANYYQVEYVWHPTNKQAISMTGRGNNPNQYLYLPSSSGAIPYDEFTCVFSAFSPDTTINIEIYHTYECVVDPNGSYRSLTTYNDCYADAIDLITPLAIAPDLWIRYLPVDTDHQHQILFAQAIADLKPKVDDVSKLKNNIQTQGGYRIGDRMVMPVYA